MSGIWAVARHTFAQCLRMKVAIAFIGLLVVALISLPILIEGDGTLAGRIRTILSYGMGATALLLSLVTVFTSVGVVASDVRDKRIFLVATKPLARWQYVLGRWLGVVLLDAALLAVAASAVYATARYLRGRDDLLLAHNRSNDRRTVETEIFTARQRVRPEPFDVEAAVAERIKAMKDSGEYASVLKELMVQTRGDPQAAEQALFGEIGRQELEKAQSAPPGGSIEWRFEDIRVAGTDIRGVGEIAARAKSDDRMLMLIKTDSRIIGRMVLLGPVQVEGVTGWVRRTGPKAFEVSFDREQLEDSPLSDVSSGDEVKLLVEPTIQLSYKLEPASSVPGDTLKSLWTLTATKAGVYFRTPRDDPSKKPATLTVSARVVDDDGSLVVRYQNLPNLKLRFATSVRIPHKEISVLYRTGSFEANYLRGALLILIQLAFLAAVGVLWASFLSFGVSCLVSGVVLLFSRMVGFLLTATKLPRGDDAPDPALVMSHYLVRGMRWILPDLGELSPGDKLVGGMKITLATIDPIALLTVAVATPLTLALACLIFRKRELARVQV